MEKNLISIFTDGSSRGNPGPGGWGAVVAVSCQVLAVSEDQVIELGGGEAHTTNNRMELSAAIGALAYVSDLKLGASSSQLRVHSDSSYVINGITKWVKGWIKKGWVTSAKTQVENRDLWERLFALCQGKNIDWRYVGGHVGVAGNERCDRIATAFADGERIDLYRGSLREYPIKAILDTSEVPALRAERSKSKGKGKSDARAYSYISEIAGVVEIHKTWPECERRVRGKRARFKKALSPDDQQRIVAEFSK
jgi:ribonuclease HI